MKRLLCLFLVVIMALTVFAGCKKESPNTPGTSDTDEETHTDTNGSETEEPKKSWKDLPKEKFNGEEYNILGRKHTPWGSDDLYATDTKTDLSAAVLPATAQWSFGTESSSMSICMTDPSTL